MKKLVKNSISTIIKINEEPSCIASFLCMCQENIFVSKYRSFIKAKNRSLLKTDTINSLLYLKSLISETDCTKWKPSEAMLKLMCVANLYEKEEATDQSATF